MKTRLYIDDIRTPDETWIVQRNSLDAINYIKENGMPDVISFDHDLGGEDTAMNVVNFIIEGVLNDKLKIPRHFIFRVHSANPVGAQNIYSKMNNFLNYIGANNV